MNTTATTERLARDGTAQDLRLFWDVYRDAMDEVETGIREEFADDPRLGPLLGDLTQDLYQADTRRLREQAFDQGEWAPYLDHLREQGAAYAEMGLEFADWFRIVRALRPHVLPRIVAAYGDDGEDLERALRGMGEFLDVALHTISEAYLAAHEATISKQRLAIEELSTPVLRIRPGLLLLPLVGVLDTARSRQLTEQLLHAIHEDRARVVVMDITGVPEVDTEVANRLVQAAEAARLMGATPVLTGISSGVAQTLVALGVDLKGLRTVGDLQGGIEAANAILGTRSVPTSGSAPRA